ncbi:MAG: L-2-amino-thiazoline-4-carboxylic acid hydrolase [Promethearchaeota archaeon]
MSDNLGRKYYLSQKPKIMVNFEKQIKLFRRVLCKQFEEKVVDQIINDTRMEYEELIPEMPYIGAEESRVGKRLTSNIINTTMGLALWKTIKKRSVTVEEAAVLLCETAEEMFNSMSRFSKIFLRTFRTLTYSFPLKHLYRRLLKNMAKKSQEREFHNNFVMHYIDGEGEEFDFGFDYTVCPINNFWREQGEEELLPYICLYDYFTSDLTGSGLIRTQTLAEGFDRCDFRFKRGRKSENRQRTQFIKRKDLISFQELD